MDKKPSMVIEVTVISAEDLFVNGRKPAKKKAFVVMKSDPFNSRFTAVSSDGGSRHTWNEKLVMEVPDNASFITAEAHSGTKVIGFAKIPVTDFVGAHLPENRSSFLSYRLRDPQGESNGIVNLSVKVIKTGNRGCAADCSRPWIGTPVNTMSGYGTVMGIPVTHR